jgi:hypothetical protein
MGFTARTPSGTRYPLRESLEFILHFLRFTKVVFFVSWRRPFSDCLSGLFLLGNFWFSLSGVFSSRLDHNCTRKVLVILVLRNILEIPYPVECSSIIAPPFHMPRSATQIVDCFAHDVGSLFLHSAKLPNGIFLELNSFPNPILSGMLYLISELVLSLSPCFLCRPESLSLIMAISFMQRNIGLLGSL